MSGVRKVINEWWECGRGHKHQSESAAIHCAKTPPRISREDHHRRMMYSAMVRLRLEGKTFKQIGSYFGMSASRTSEILKKCERIARCLLKGAYSGRALPIDDECAARLCEQLREESQ